MNSRQKLVQQQFLNNEEQVIKRLKSVYDQSMSDINGKIAKLDKSIAQLQAAYNDINGDDIGDLAKAALGSKANFTPEEAKETLQSMIQSKVYQKNYQQGLQKQVGDVLDKMHTQQFKTVSEYLDKCYEEGFLGTMYDLQGQGIPLCFPMDQEQMVRAVQLDSKIRHGLYQRLGQDIDQLKTRITNEVSRGISSGMRWEQVAQQLSNKTGIGYTNAVRIARTEGHRIQCQAGMDACHKARNMGADVLKQWDATLDGKVRDSHAKIDGEIKELDEEFSNGLRFPGDPHGAAAEVINCRCALLQRARWALGDGFTKMDNFTGEIKEFDSPETYSEFQKFYFSKENRQYMQYSGEMQQKYGKGFLSRMTETEYQRFTKLSDARPIFEGIYKGQPVVKLKTGDYAAFKTAYQQKLQQQAQAQSASAIKPDYNCAMAKEFGKDHYDAMHNMIVNCPDQKTAEMWKKYEDQIKVGNAHHNGGAFARFDSVYLDVDRVAKGNSINTPYQTAFHEGGHAIDHLVRKMTKDGQNGAFHYSSAYKNGLFPQTIKDEVDALVSVKDKELKALFKQHAGDVDWFKANGYMQSWQTTPPKYRKALAYSAVEKEVKAIGNKLAYGDLSDMLEGATRGKISTGIGHGASYWTQRTYGGVPDGLATEAFAEMTSATLANPESLAVIKQYLPKSYQVYQDMLDDLLK